MDFIFTLKNKSNQSAPTLRMHKTGVYMAHLGFLFIYFGVAGSLGNQGYFLQGRPGQTFSFRNYEVTIESFGTENHLLYETLRATLILHKDGEIKNFYHLNIALIMTAVKHARKWLSTQAQPVISMSH